MTDDRFQVNPVTPPPFSSERVMLPLPSEIDFRNADGLLPLIMYQARSGSDGPARVMVLDLSGTRFMDSQGIRLINDARRLLLPHTRVHLVAQMDGGGHERGNRSGTLNVPSIVGFAKACRIMQEEGEEEARRIQALRDRLHDRIRARLDLVTLNGHPERRLAGNLNLSFSFVEGEGLMMAIKDVAVSSGSACTSASLEPSYVLRAMGLDEELAHSSIRFGLGRFTTEAEVDYVADLVVEKVNRLRDMSPLYEMFKEGVDLKSIQWTPH